jgi:hypothetical protein
MLAITYKALPHPQITLYSRTSYLGYLAPLDISIAWMCGRYLAKVMGGRVEDMAFQWFNECMQFHYFKSMAFLLNHQDPKKRKLYRKLLMAPEDKLKDKHLEILEAPALKASRKWVQKTLAEDERGDTLGDISYNTYRRVKRRFHTEVMGYDYAQKFEGWSYWKKGPNEGEKREFYPAYAPLPSTPIHSLDFSKLGLPSYDNLFEVAVDMKEAAKAAKEEDED